MTYIPSLDPNSARNLSLDEYIDYFDGIMPDWQTREQYGDRFISESDVAHHGADVTAWQVPEDDFEAMCEALWADPLESDWDFYRHEPTQAGRTLGDLYT